MYPDPSSQCSILAVVVPNIVCLIEEISVEGARYGAKNCTVVPVNLTGNCHLPKAVECYTNKCKSSNGAHCHYNENDNLFHNNNVLMLIRVNYYVIKYTLKTTY